MTGDTSVKRINTPARPLENSVFQTVFTRAVYLKEVKKGM